MSNTTQAAEGTTLLRAYDCVPRIKDKPDYRGTTATTRPNRAAQALRESGRRRGVDPTTCDREFSAGEVEFMSVIQAYKAESGRMFPTWSEVLTGLGYDKD